jgi:hypothetical protein
MQLKNNNVLLKSGWYYVKNGLSEEVKVGIKRKI